MERRSIENELNLSWHWDGPVDNTWLSTLFCQLFCCQGEPGYRRKNVAFYILNVYIYVKG